MAHHVGTEATSQQWTRLCNNLIHRVVGLFPENTHPPIIYPVAATAAGKPAAVALLKWLSEPQARAIFVKYGF